MNSFTTERFGSLCGKRPIRSVYVNRASDIDAHWLPGTTHRTRFKAQSNYTRYVGVVSDHAGFTCEVSAEAVEKGDEVLPQQMCLGTAVQRSFQPQTALLSSRGCSSFFKLFQHQLSYLPPCCGRSLITTKDRGQLRALLIKKPSDKSGSYWLLKSQPFPLSIISPTCRSI